MNGNINWEESRNCPYLCCKGIVLRKGGRPNVMPCIAFLTTRVKSPTEEHWSKLILLSQFLKSTKDDALRLMMNNNYIVKYC
jgi:hypothetical protein